MLPLSDLFQGWPLHWQRVKRLPLPLRAQAERLARSTAPEALVLRATPALPIAQGLMWGMLAVTLLALLAAGRLCWNVGILAVFRDTLSAADMPWLFRLAEFLGCLFLVAAWGSGLYWVFQEAYEIWALNHRPEEYFIAFLEQGILKRRGAWAGFIPWERIRHAKATTVGGAHYPAGGGTSVPAVKVRLRGWPFAYVLIQPPWGVNLEEAQHLARYINANARRPPQAK